MTPPRFLVCAGSTRESMDRVREWGNIFTGGTGFDIALALAQLGPVDLLTANEGHLARLSGGLGRPHSLRGFSFRSHGDLGRELDRLMKNSNYQAVLMSAAVSDYSPDGSFRVMGRQENPGGGETWQVQTVQAAKVKSDHGTIAVLGQATEKIVDSFRKRYEFKGFLVKFKLEVGIDTPALLDIGEKSRVSSGADLLVANTLDMVAGETPGAWLLGDGEPRFVGRKDLAGTLGQMVARRLKIALGAPEKTLPPLAGQMALHCRQFAAILEHLSPESYRARPGHSSIGEHVRHGLDHLRAILLRGGAPLIDFENRRRGWEGEQNPALARAEFEHLALVCETLTDFDMAAPVRVRCCIDPHRVPVEVSSTLGRELLFGLSHEIHHGAILRPILEKLAVKLPPGFGIAPSTVAYRETLARGT